MSQDIKDGHGMPVRERADDFECPRMDRLAGPESVANVMDKILREVR